MILLFLIILILFFGFAAVVSLILFFGSVYFAEALCKIIKKESITEIIASVILGLFTMLFSVYSYKSLSHFHAVNADSLGQISNRSDNLVDAGYQYLGWFLMIIGIICAISTVYFFVFGLNRLNAYKNLSKNR
jgi:divalent metal cation (Fe/Co/Zn/Cd) transporter